MTGRRILVTGAASGIGRAVALLAAEREPDVALGLVDLDPDGLVVVAGEVTARGGRCVTVTADLAEVSEPARSVAVVVAALGGLDVLVSNAGATGRGSLLETTVEEWQQAFDLNARATWLLARAAYDALATARGAVVVTTSISAQYPTPRAGAYSVSKAALSMLVRQLALEWGPAGVRVNAVAPGPIHTPMTFGSFGDADDPVARERRRAREASTPLGRLGEAGDVAEVVLFLASGAAAHLTGVEIPVDGGLATTLMPGSREGHVNR
jgi:NAD(P)-dependent dehydrogenase (short-subunit alcohol dehydrogenase family)